MNVYDFYHLCKLSTRGYQLLWIVSKNNVKWQCKRNVIFRAYCAIASTSSSYCDSSSSFHI